MPKKINISYNNMSICIRCGKTINTEKLSIYGYINYIDPNIINNINYEINSKYNYDDVPLLF